MRPFLVVFLLSLSLVFLAVFLFAYHRLAYMLNIHVSSDYTSVPIDWKVETQFVTTADNVKIAYVYVPVKNSKAVVILLHGYRNPGGKSLMVAHAAYLRAAGYSTVLVDLRAHGESDGNKVSLGAKEWQDVAAVFDEIKKLPETKNQKIGFFGISMGASTAIVTNGLTEKGDFIIASVPFSTFDAVFIPQIRKAGLPPQVFLPFVRAAARMQLGVTYRDYMPLAVIDNIRVPIFLIQALEDTVVENQGVSALYERAQTEKEIWRVSSPHDVYWKNGPEFEKRVLEFLAKVTAKKSS